MFEWIISSCVLILVIILLRQVTVGRISSRLRYALWLPVLLRLLVPISFAPSDVSVAGAIPENVTNRVGTAVTEPLGYVGYELPDLAMPEPDPTLSEAEQTLQYEENLAKWESEIEHAKAETGHAVTMENILAAIWIAGALTFGLCLVISNLHFGARLRRSRVPLDVEARRPVYVSPIVETPCLFGLFRPAVYVTPEVAEDESVLRHVLAHECTHARHGDNVWAALRGVCLALHWYNPLVWLAAALSRQDAELACDESVILSLGEDERTSYGSTLIALATGHGGLLLTATTMSGSKRSLKERIALIAKKPKNAAIAIAVVLLIAAAAVVCTFTGGNDGWHSVDAQSLSADSSLKVLPGEIRWSETAYVYEAEFDHTANEEKIRERIGNNAGADGYLRISDSGIILRNDSPNGRRIELAVPYNAQPDATMSYQLMGVSKDDYGTADLSFMPMKEAAKKAVEDIEALGISGFELAEAYSIDKDTLSRHVAAQLEAERAVAVMSEEELQKIYPFLYKTITEEDECYFFVFQLMLDDIPTMTCPSSQVELDIFGSELYCLYNKTGIIDLQSRWVPSGVQQVGEAQPIISADEAYNIMLKYLPETAGAAWRVEELTFCYTFRDKKSAQLSPTWVLKTSGEFERMGILNSDVELVTIYDYYAIDAITGEPLIREMKLKDIAAATGLNADASIGNLEWGATRDEVIAIAEGMSAEQGFTVNSSGDRFVSLRDYPIFGSTADITLEFSEYSPEDYPTLDESTEQLLTRAEIFVKPAEWDDIVSKICAVLGAQETKRLGFYDYAGDIGYEFGSEIDDERDYYWHGRQNVIESLGLEKLKSIYPDKTEKEILKTFFNTYEYTVYVRDSEYITNLEEDTLLVTIEAGATVIKDILSR